MGNLHSCLPLNSEEVRSVSSRMIENLLASCLPLKSLLESSFAAPIENNINLKVMCYSHQSIYLLDNEGSHHKDLEIDHTPEITRHPLQFWGSCQGMLCVTTRRWDHMDLFLWNPCTGEHKKIPSTKTSPKRDIGSYVAFGLGYNPTANDYEILKVTSYSGDIYDSEIEVYSLRKNSWMRVEDIPYVVNNISYLGKHGELVNGALHWVANHSGKPYGNPAVVIAYDLKNKTVREVPLPDHENKSLFGINIAELSGNLCVLFHYKKRVEGWILKRYGSRELWTMLFNIMEDPTCPINTYTLELLCFMKKGAEILVRDHKCLYVYDTTNQCARELEVKDHPERIYQATTYTESILPLSMM